MGILGENIFTKFVNYLNTLRFIYMYFIILKFT